MISSTENSNLLPEDEIYNLKRQKPEGFHDNLKGITQFIKDPQPVEK